MDVEVAAGARVVSAESSLNTIGAKSRQIDTRATTAFFVDLASSGRRRDIHLVCFQNLM
jgi:hypothetical protein